MAGSPPTRRGKPDNERLGVIVIVVVALLVVGTVAAFVYIGNVAGFVMIAIAAAVTLWAGVRWDRRGPVEVAEPVGDDVVRTLVFVDTDVDPERLARQLGKLEENGARELRVVVPARTDRLRRVASDVDLARSEALERTEAIVAALAGDFGAVAGDVGDSDDRLALEDALRTYPADELVLVNAPPDRRDALQDVATERAERDVPLRVVELTCG
ncbi:MAG TPA: hypothetical protein VFH44_00710 [Solirubrobacterales bacterium]|nr:hypothetical protein [Solirubrobacterales bacterium]